ncbi:DUF4139 domain-containing protein [Marimonas arenosa]|uniref:DUF4139 domain-containing protein n=1 Tax=Marimonas arenosa TaxID=1795305 RepID=A0AAE4B4Q5_9RHOB|nr:DUF4139 domain-containing protein [Marimonas arenosa]MDQ2089629.1 DUF4139 domain-containing protein [Marimonas arenosa]
MRALPLVLVFFPSVVLADEIALTSTVSEVTLYPDGARIVRSVPFAAPAGDHVLRLLDVPAGAVMETLRVKVDGATMGAVTVRESYVPPRGDTESDALKAAREEVERLEDAVRAKADEAEALRLAKEAADTRITFLGQLGEGEALTGATADQLREVARMIGEETLAARQAQIAAEAQARAVDRDIRDLKDDLADAEAALEALVPETEERNLVEVRITAAAATDGRLTLIYNDWEAGWMPVYDVHLDQAGGTRSLRIERKALIGQSTGENWQGVKLGLSTSRPGGQSEPGVLWPRKLEIGDPEPPRPVLMRKSSDMAGAAMPEAMVMAEPSIVEEAVTRIGEFNVVYDYPTPVDLANEADDVRITLGTVEISPDLQALAVPRRDQTAFLTAAFVNESGEMILPSDEAQFFLDGEFVGRRGMAHIAAGAEARLSFGPIDGLRLKRVVDRNEGDRGVLTRSNEITEQAQIEVENLTGRTWPMRVLDQVPYSEQEDLVITWTARPRPSEVDVEDGKGILAWEFEIGAGETRTIDLNHRIEWPEGKVLR